MLMFKVLVLQRLHGLADDATSFQITDRSSFRAFLGLTPRNAVPDGQTISDFRVWPEAPLDAETFLRSAGADVGSGKKSFPRRGEPPPVPENSFAHSPELPPGAENSFAHPRAGRGDDGGTQHGHRGHKQQLQRRGPAGDDRG